MTPDEFRERFAACPDLHVHRLDVPASAALIVPLGREGYRAASFLDDRALAPGAASLWIPLAELQAATDALPAGRPLHFIWHTGHVGSTLLSRLLDEVPGVLPLREPLPLRTLAEMADSLGTGHSLVDEEHHARLVGVVVSSWARGYPDTCAVVVKATSATARVAPRVLRQVPAARSVHISLGLEPYLAASLVRRTWPVDLRTHGPERMRRLQAKIPAPLSPLWSLSVGELAAMSWLTETWTGSEVMRQSGGRVHPVDFEALLADVPGTMARVLAHLGLPFEERVLAGMEGGGVLARHSKAPDQPYSPEIRAAALRDSRERNREEILAGLRWVERLAESVADVGNLLRG